MLLRMIAFAVLFSTSLQAQEKSTYLTTVENYKIIKNAIKNPQPMALTHSLLTSTEDSKQYVKIKLSEAEVEKVSHLMHDKNHTCGGGLTLEDDNVDASHLIETFSKLELNKSDRSFDKIGIRYKQQTNLFLNGLNIQNVMNFITNMASFENRYSRSENGKKATDWLVSKTLELRNQFRREDVTVFQVKTKNYLQNSVVVKMEGANPNEKALVFGAHMDTLRGNMPGADDDASGTSTVYELYHNALRMKYKFKRPVYFIFYAAEEVGLVGSKYVVDHFFQQNIGVKAVMQLDMTGFDNGNSTDALFFVRDFTSDSLTDYTKRLAQSYLGKSIKQLRDLKCRYACSDHARWSKKGVPAVFPFEAKFGDHNKDIHKPTDAMNKISQKHVKQFLLLAGAFLVELGEPATSLVTAK